MSERTGKKVYAEGEVASVPDPAGKEVWCQPSGNPFGHGCCECGLAHSVRYRAVNDAGDPVAMEGLHLQLRFTVDRELTAHLRESKEAAAPDEVKDVRAILRAHVAEGTVTRFMGVDISLLDKEDLVRVLTIIGEQRAEQRGEKSIILPGQFCR